MAIPIAPTAAVNKTITATLLQPTNPDRMRNTAASTDPKAQLVKL